MTNDELRHNILSTLKVLFERSETKRSLQKTPSELKEELFDSLPEHASGFEEVLIELEEKVIPHLNQNTDPSYAAYITGSGHRISVIADVVKAYFNQNSLKWNNSPIASELEQLVLKWTADFLGVSDFRKGVLTGSGSMSNFLAIHFALAHHFPDREEQGLPKDVQPVVFCSAETHSSVERAMVFLGLGRASLQKIPVNEGFQIDIDGLEESLNQLQPEQKPIMLIGNAGSTNTGSVDDLRALAAIARKHGMWYHVDGAYGLPAARVDTLKHHFTGFEEADSITVNHHKWLFVNFEASCVLVRDFPNTFTFNPAYLTDFEAGRWESSSQTVDLSKEFRALKIWFTFKYLGAERISEYISHDVQMTQYFAAELEKTGIFEVEPTHPLSIVCFRVNLKGMTGEENRQLTRKTIEAIEKDNRIFLTGTRLHGEPYIRAYFGNPERTQADVDYMVEVLREIITGLTAK